MSIKDGRKPRIRRSPEASRDNILTAAEGLLTEKGPQALRLADVAAAAGVANATVLHHFGSIDEVEAALMERMIGQLVERILAEPHETASSESYVSGLRTLFDAFETRGAARLAAWLELTDESQRLTTVKQAVSQVAASRVARSGLDQDAAEDLVLLSVVLAMGVGLFGRSLDDLLAKPPGRARELAMGLLQAHLASLAARER
jgi:AcrR family transcriptional regulator